jgi:hypothetical protein
MVFAMTTFNSELHLGLFYIGGSIGFPPFSNIYKLDSFNYTMVGSNFETPVTALCVYNSELYAGAYLNVSGGPFNQHACARWDGASWINISVPSPVQVFAEYNGDLYIGGAGLNKMNSTSFSTIAVGSSASPAISAMAVYNGELYVGGSFTSIGGTPLSGIAKWNGSSWSAVGGNLAQPSGAGALIVFNGELYAGGGFNFTGGASTDNVAKWNGTYWAPCGFGTNGIVNTLAVHNGELYAGGLFSTAGGTSVNNIAKFTPCTVAPSQPASISGITDPCPGDTITYTVPAVAGSVAYVWSLPQGWTGVSFSDTIMVVAGTNSGVISVVAGNSCSMGTQQTLTVSPKVMPSVVISPTAPPAFCIGDSVILTATSASLTFTLQWRLNGIPLPGATGQSYAAAQTGSYSVNIDDGVCRGASYAVIVTAHSVPVITLSFSGGNLSLTSGFSSYQWYYNSALIPGATTNSYAPLQTGTYSVVVIDSNGCSAQDSMFVIPTEISDASPNAITLSPNPNTGIFTISGKLSGNTKEVRILIRDITGRLVHTADIPVADGRLEEILSLAELPSGVYSLQLITAGKNTVRSFLKE